MTDPQAELYISTRESDNVELVTSRLVVYNSADLYAAPLLQLSVPIVILSCHIL